MCYIGDVKTGKIRQRAAAIYVISNEVTGAKYYGSALRVGVRRQRHFYDLRAGSHMNPHLQAAWNKYGESAFTFTVLAYLEKEYLLPTEQRLLDRYVGREDCYNCSLVAGAPMAGRKHSAATKARLSEAGKGRIVTEESRARYSAANKKKGISRETLEMAWAANRGKKHTAEHNAKIGAARVGKKQKPETVEKRVAKLRGRKERPEVVAAKRLRKISLEHREKIAASRRGVIATAETRARMAASQTGRVQSPETRAKCAAIKAAWWAAKKAAIAS
jgi:group I intron endonuclease